MKSIYILSICVSLILISCGVTSKMHNKTENKKLVNELVEQNGNAFCIRSTYIIISYVWTYTENEIVVFKLRKGRIENENRIAIEKNTSWITIPTKESLFELDACMELDGDMFEYWIKKGEYIEQESLPINLDCFQKREYKLDFFNVVVNDIKQYQIKW